MNPPPPPAVAERQKKALEEAIQKVEAEYGAAEAGSSEPADELEAIFASLSEPKPRSAPTEPEPAALANRPPQYPAATMPSALSGTREEDRPTAEPPVGSPRKPAAQKERPVSEEPLPEPSAFASDSDSFFLDGDDDPFDGETASRPRRRGRGATVLVALLVLIVIAGAAYGAWFKRGEIASALGVQLPEFARVTQTTPARKDASTERPVKKAETPRTVDKKPATAPSTEPAAGKDKQAGATATPAPVTKFTQRLAADGTESNPGPATGEAKVGEGASVAAATTEDKALAGQNAPAQSPSSTDKAQVPVAQRAIFYEERTNTEQGSASTGTVVWTRVKESPGGELPAEPAIRGEVSIPAKNLQLRITIRRNGDKTLPASHIVELIFLTPDNFEGGGIDNVLRMAMKDTEQAPGSPILGIPAKIADGYFLLALNDGKAEIETNTTLLRREGWIDIPVVYKSGRRALVTLEKGIPGDKVFDDVLNAWEQTPIGPEETPAPANDNGDAGGDAGASKPAPAGGTSG
jgi:hypothetical protein